MRKNRSLDRAVIGAGLMGHGIAQVLGSQPGIVWLYDVNPDALILAQKRIRINLDTLERYHLVSKEDICNILDRIRPTTDLSTAVQSAWLVVEAVPENIELKQNIMVDVETFSGSQTIFASNTSSFSMEQVFSRVEVKNRVIGSHFFLPAQVLPLVEVARSPWTSDETMDRTVKHWQSCGKVPIRQEKHIPGYIANRLQAALVREATNLVNQGIANASDIDKAVRMSFGLRFLVSGPLEQRDITGLDFLISVSQSLWPDLDCGNGPHKYVIDKVDRGELGVKSGHGFYEWPGKDLESVYTSKNEELIAKIAALGLWQSSTEDNPNR